MSAARRKQKIHTSAPVFAALGDEMRLRLVSRLVRSGPLSITELASGAPVTRQAITKHLHVLEGAGLVHGSRLGREQRWELKPEQFQQARRYLDMIAKEWDEALGRLKASLEQQP